MKRRLQPISCILAAGLITGSPLAADFRVEGVYGLPGDLRALVNSKDETETVRAGSIVNGVKIVGVVPKGVQIEHDGQLVLVPIGGGAAARAPEITGMVDSIDLGPRDEAAARLRAAEKALTAEADERAVAAGVARALSLPEQARIAAIRGVEIDGPLDALRTIRKAVAQGRHPHLNIANVPGMDEIYVGPTPETWD